MSEEYGIGLCLIVLTFKKCHLVSCCFFLCAFLSCCQMLQLYFLARAAEGSSRYLVRLPFKQSLFCFFRNFHLRLSQMGMAERQSGLIFVYLKACISFPL